MKLYSFLLVFIFTCTSLFSQEKTIKVSEKLSLTQLNANTYIHTADNSNGLVYVAGKEAVIISTPPTDKATQELLVWIQDSLKATVTACIVDHWHHDAMEGIDILHQQNIPTYSFIRTQQIAKSKGLPTPKNTFNDSLVLSLGDKKIIARYFGPSHSADDIVVWLPNEQILFGSCGVKSLNGWVGNIADAHLGDWSTTIEKVKATYPNAKTVIPGHGKYGDTSLLSYTIEMFDPLKCSNDKYCNKKIDYSNLDSSLSFLSKKMSVINGNDSFIDVLYSPYLIDKDSVTIVIYRPDNDITLFGSIYSKKQTTPYWDDGLLLIMNKKRTIIKHYLNFKYLAIFFKDDDPGFTMVIEKFTF